tara:strand:- start:5440 stop:5934 length:495 start_codon:yes stop_codon:yes gene_type:complete
MNIFIIGMMGTGKSTIGILLANKVKKPFIDLDEEIEKSTKRTISDIFRIDGENIFRKIETEHLKKVSDSVISCGGGIILKEENRNLIRRNGTTILLTASIRELTNRLKYSNKRPLLAQNSPEDSLSELWSKRKDHYSSTADITIETDGKTPEIITNEILINLKS